MTPTFGEQLRQSREARFLTQEQAAHDTHIRLRYVQAMEAGNLSAFPSPAQARGFLRAYAEYLKLESAALIASAGDSQSLLSAQPALPAAEQPGPAAAAAGADIAAADSAGDSFAKIGFKLRSQRELLGLSLEDVERHTHLRLHYLQSLERGDLAGLPSPVQGRGMLHNYARFLGTDSEPLLLQFAEGLQERLKARRGGLPRQPILSSPGVGVSPARRIFSVEMLAAGLLGLFLLAFVGWGVIRINEMRAGQTPTSTALPISQALAAPTTALPSPTPLLSTGTPTPEGFEGAVPLDITPTSTPPPASNAPLQVYIVVQQRAWMRISVDGEVAFEGRAVAGSAHSFAGDERIELLTGNGAALQVFFNTADLGPAGEYGEVIQRIFTLDGVQTPTATITPTPLPVTPTITPTATP
jgi:cytoskeletal protein RodZ